jgi:GMP synthase-like glutamine amidotransferase
MQIIVFQHVTGDNGGSFLAFMAKGGAGLTVVNFELGHHIPSLESFDAMLVLGGPMDVWDVDIHPWMVAEKHAIRHFVATLGRPYLGLCLGHQLLADALGGTCGPQRPKQVGPFDIALTAEGRKSPLFAGFSDRFKAYKWHGVRVAQWPEGATRLAISDACSCEALQWGRSAFGVQFHPEFHDTTLDDWHTIEGSPASYIEHFGEGGLQTARDQALPFLQDYRRNAGILVENFLRVARQ